MNKSFSSNLFLVVSMATSDWSMPIHFLPHILAASNVEPDPQKQSITMELGDEDASIIKLSISMFFSVGYMGRVGSLNTQKTCAIFLMWSTA